jgi:hypothetical protein
VTFDLLCSEYGWTKDYVLDCVTPAQMGVLAAAIGRRRRADALREIGLIRAAVWGDERRLAELSRELTDDDEPETAQKLAAMGITVRSKASGPGGDDGQPAS